MRLKVAWWFGQSGPLNLPGVARRWRRSRSDSAPAMEPAPEQEAEPLVVGGLALEGEWRSSLGPVLKCDGRVAAFVGYGNYPLTLTE